jgi:hypothetical protein
MLPIGNKETSCMRRVQSLSLSLPKTDVDLSNRQVNTRLGSTLSSPKLIISVKEARKLLGGTGKDLSNSDIEAMVRDYSSLARYAIRDYLVRK